MSRISVDISTLSGWASLQDGSHSITIKAKATGYLTSEESISVTVLKDTTVYNIIPTLTNVTASPQNPTTIQKNDTVTLEYTTDSNYKLPSNIPVVTGAQVESWSVSPTSSGYIGELEIKNPTADVTFTINGILLNTYSLTASLTHVSCIETIPTTIREGSAITLHLSRSGGEYYKLPETVSVENASSTWTKESDSNGTLVIYNPTGNVSFSIEAEYKDFTITPTLQNVQGNPSNPTTIKFSEIKSLYYTAKPGYDLPTSVVASGATSTWDNQTGQLTLSNATSNVSFTITGLAKTYTLTNSLSNVSCTTTIPSSIQAGQSITLTFTPDIRYLLPDNITVTGDVIHTWTKDSGTLTLQNPTSDVSFTIAGELSTYPVKGDLIKMKLGVGSIPTPDYGTLDQYRVLSINGSIAKVVAMYSYYKKYNTTPTYSNTYENSIIDDYLTNTFYSSIDSSIKDAITTTSITQDTWSYSNTKPTGDSYIGTYDGGGSTGISYYLQKTEEGTTEINRKVYVMSVQEVLDYLGTTTSMIKSNTTLTYQNIRKLFLDTAERPSLPSNSRNNWFRCKKASSTTWNMTTDYSGTYCYSNIIGIYTDNEKSINPCFTIDLSQIDYTILPDWENPTESSTNLTLTQTNKVTQSSNTLTIE